MAQRINELFGLNAPPGQGNMGGGLAKVVADQQSNSLIIVGTDDSYGKLLQMLKRLDAAPEDTGRVRVVALQHAKAEDLANVLTQMLQGQKKEGAAPGTPSKSDMFEGDVRVTADKATNSVIITSSARDYASMRLVLSDLDMPRRQVFIEAVIMDLDVTDNTKVGTSWHGGYQTPIGGGNEDSTFLGGFKADRSMAFPRPVDPTMLQGLALGVRGPNLAGSDTLLGQAGVSIPAFGVVLNALTTSGSSNVLASPHIIATDNVPAEIQIGKNVPLQTNTGSGLSSLLGAAGTSGANTSNIAAAMPMMGMGMMGAAPRQDVGIKIKVTPHINNAAQVRLELEQESSDRGAAEGQLGAVSIIKRTANTTITVDDQQTVVIGGLTKEEQSRSDEKVPVLGDIPILGFLFRHQTTDKKRSNLMLISDSLHHSRSDRPTEGLRAGRCRNDKSSSIVTSSSADETGVLQRTTRRPTDSSKTSVKHTSRSKSKSVCSRKANRRSASTNPVRPSIYRRSRRRLQTPQVVHPRLPPRHKRPLPSARRMRRLPFRRQLKRRLRRRQPRLADDPRAAKGASREASSIPPWFCDPWFAT
ncbi:MAG: secretin N-terminal domain-containing protein [Polyangiaceae bacterium]